MNLKLHRNKIFNYYWNGEFEIFEPVDVVRVIAMGGGLKNPKTKSGKIIKANGEVIEVPIRKLLTTGGAAGNEAFMLYPGDTFYVPKTFSIPWSAWNLIVTTLTGTITLYLLISQI